MCTCTTLPPFPLSLFGPHLPHLSCMAGGQVYSVRVRVDSDRVLGMLLEKAQFSIARSYANIVESTACEVTVKEVGILSQLVCIAH